MRCKYGAKWEPLPDHPHRRMMRPALRYFGNAATLRDAQDKSGDQAGSEA